MANYYRNLFNVTENADIFDNDRKQELTTLDKIGLEAVLTDFCVDYEEETTGERPDPERIKNYIRYNNNSVDFLDGYTDTYIFNHYAIGSAWTTKNGCIMLDAVDLDTYTADDEEEKEDFENCDTYEKPGRYDVWSVCERTLFRLD